jgi:hypothetical protein
MEQFGDIKRIKALGGIETFRNLLRQRVILMDDGFQGTR